MGRGNERGGGRTTNGGRGGRGGRRQNRTAATPTPTVEKLSTAKPGLEKHIFYINKPDQAHNFIETKKEILWHLTTHLKDGGVMMKALEDEKPFSETKPILCERDTDGNPLVDEHGKIKMIAKVDKTTPEGYEYDLDFKDWRDRKRKHEENMVTASGIILAQCTKSVINKLEARVDWDTIRLDPIELMKAVRAITQDSEDEKYHLQSVLTLLKKLVNAHQMENENLSSYTQRFKTLVDLFETKFGKLNMDACCAADPRCKAIAQTAVQDQMKQEAYDRFLALIHMRLSTSLKAKEVAKKCNNECNRGINHYPKNIEDAHKMIYNHVLEGNPQHQQQRKKQSGGDEGTRGAVFTQAQMRELVPGKDGTVHAKVTCYKCNKKGHCKSQCPGEQTRQQGAANANAGSDASAGAGTQQEQGGARQSSDQSQSGMSAITNDDGNSVTQQGGNNQTTRQGSGSTQVRRGVGFCQRGWTHSMSKVVNHLAGQEPNRMVQEATNTMKKAAKLAASNMTLQQRMRNWIPLDNQSTDHIFCNKELLDDIKLGNETLELISNGGCLTTNKTGQFDALKERVWHHEEGVTNILSFAQIRALGYKIDYDCEKDCFIVS